VQQHGFTDWLAQGWSEVDVREVRADLHAPVFYPSDPRGAVHAYRF